MENEEQCYEAILNHSVYEFVRDGDGFWLLLRAWLKPDRGIFQAKLPLE